jgi:hypothetical protein
MTPPLISADRTKPVVSGEVKVPVTIPPKAEYEDAAARTPAAIMARRVATRALPKFDMRSPPSEKSKTPARSGHKVFCTAPWFAGHGTAINDLSKRLLPKYNAFKMNVN